MQIWEIVSPLPSVEKLSIGFVILIELLVGLLDSLAELQICFHVYIHFYLCASHGLSYFCWAYYKNSHFLSFFNREQASFHWHFLEGSRILGLCRKACSPAVVFWTQVFRCESSLNTSSYALLLQTPSWFERLFMLSWLLL